MIGDDQNLSVLLVEDDEENLNLLIETLPREVSEYTIVWDPCSDFQEAVRLVDLRRYDLIVTDIYRDREDHNKGIDPEDEKALDILNSIRDRRFCPVVAFTDGTAPQSFEKGPFIKLADKSEGNGDIIKKIEELIDTGTPLLAKKLHDELDRAAGSYLWGFLEDNWNALQNDLSTPDILERLVRRRASIQIGRLDPSASSPAEIENVEGVEFYICPPVSEMIRLGQILQHQNKKEYWVVLTPHCHLTVQQGESEPKTDYVLVAGTVSAQDLLEQHPPKGGTKPKKLKDLASKMRSPANKLGRPDGRYWFLPRFLDMPDLYCDLLQIKSLPFDEINAEYKRFAVLDTPFAEALQSCFTRFYSAVGLPNLKADKFERLIPG